MNDMIHSNSLDSELSEGNSSITEMTDALLSDARKLSLQTKKTISVPLSQISTLGAGVSSLLPAFKQVTQGAATHSQTLYQLANADVGDTLKMAKNGNFWGAFKTADGGSKFAQLKAVDPVSNTSNVVMQANPATMMMAVALFSIEKELGNIEAMQKQILSFLEIEKESQIEGDVVTLTDITTKYKYSWDNAQFVSSNHKLACDIQRSARTHMISYQKQVTEALKEKQFIVIGSRVNSTLAEMLKKFKYYRLSLYTYSLSYLVEIILSGNFKEENIQASVNEIRKVTDEYRSLFGECSAYLEKMSNGSVQAGFLKGAGAASNAMGKLIGNIPKVKDKQANGFLIKQGEKLKDNAQKVSLDVIESFAEVNNPNTGGLLRNLEDMNQIYNKTTGICFDEENLYLVVE